MPDSLPEFRLGSVLSTSFTATLTERRGDPVERIPTPQRLLDWLSVNGLPVGSCTTDEFTLARQLREAFHAAASARACDHTSPPQTVRTIKECTTPGRPPPGPAPVLRRLSLHAGA